MPDHHTSSASGPSAASPALSGIAGLVAAAAALAAGELVTGIAGEPSLVSLVGEGVIDLTPGSGAQQANSVLGSNNKPALIIGTIVLSLLFGFVLGQISRRRSWPAVAGFIGFGLVGAWAASRSELASTSIEVSAAVVAVLVGLVSFFFLRSRAVEASSRVAAAAGSPAVAKTPTTTPAGTVTSYDAEVKRAGIDAVDSGAAAETVVDSAPALAPEPIVVPPMATPVGAGVASMPAARRRFLAWAGGGAAAAGATALAGRSLSGRASVEGARAGVVLPEATNRVNETTSTAIASETGTTSPSLDRFLDNDVADITPMVVPNDEFYRIDTALVVPQVDPATWKLTIGGMVDNPFELTFDELLAMDQVEEAVTLSCVSNPVGGDLVGNAVWQGVPLLDVLERAGIQPGAEQVVSSSVDGWSCGFPLEVLDGRPALIAVAQNGEPLPVIHGFPARLVISGLYGYVSATKWLSNIRLDTWDNFDGYWVPRGWSKLGPIKTQSRIDVPAQRDVRAGSQAIAGVAWAGERGIDRVEVQIDEGDWQTCTLGEEMARTSWRQWKFDWDATPGRHVIRVRATDGESQVQTSDLANVAPNGATGHHAIGVTVA